MVPRLVNLLSMIWLLYLVTTPFPWHLMSARSPFSTWSKALMPHTRTAYCQLTSRVIEASIMVKNSHTSLKHWAPVSFGLLWTSALLYHKQSMAPAVKLLVTIIIIILLSGEGRPTFATRGGHRILYKSVLPLLQGISGIRASSTLSYLSSLLCLFFPILFFFFFGFL